jgi:vancomycin permeability regulator SanA
VAFSADNKDELPFELALREILARANTILDLYVFQTSPKFLGEKENVGAK